MAKEIWSFVQRLRILGNKLPIFERNLEFSKITSSKKFKNFSIEVTEYWSNIVFIDIFWRLLIRAYQILRGSWLYRSTWNTRWREEIPTTVSQPPRATSGRSPLPSINLWPYVSFPWLEVTNFKNMLRMLKWWSVCVKFLSAFPH